MLFDKERKFSLWQEMENISADMDLIKARRIAERDYGLLPEKIEKVHGYDDLNFYLIPPIKCGNGVDRSEMWPHGYMLKVINWKESNNVQFFEEYVNVLLHLNKEKFPCPCPIKNKEDKYLSSWSELRDDDEDEDEDEEEIKKRKHIVIVLQYLPGEVLENFQYNEKVNLSIGRVLSQLHTKLKPFRSVEGLHRRKFPWALQSVPDIAHDLLYVVEEEPKRLLIARCVNEFRNKVLSNLSILEKGVIHGDFNLGNLLVQQVTENGEEELKIVGIIDFSDMHSSYCLFDIALTACYISLHNVDRYADSIALLLLGYDKQLPRYEFQLLKICICARLCQSLLLGLQTLAVNPGNDYVRNGAPIRHGWSLLNKFSKMSNQEFMNLIYHKMTNFRDQFKLLQPLPPPL